jgi:hypothetical protein
MDLIRHDEKDLSVPQKIQKCLSIVQIWQKNDDIDNVVKGQIVDLLKEARKSNFEKLREFILTLPQKSKLNEFDELFEEFIELTY